MTTTPTIAEVVARMDEQYGHSPHYLIGQIEAFATDNRFGTPRQRLARITRAINAWEARQEQEHTCS